MTASLNAENFSIDSLSFRAMPILDSFEMQSMISERAMIQEMKFWPIN
jgi:hypothetical protein